MSAERFGTLNRPLLAAVLLGASLGAQQALAAADIVVNFTNTGTVGYNDPTPAAPVGGNPGTTLGEQRRIATQHAANLWAATLTSAATIRINAQFTAQACTETSATLGSAGPIGNFRNFPEATFQNTWYPSALRNKLAGNEAAAGAAQLQINFNVNLGTPGCLTASPWYFGIDNSPPPGAINLVVVLLHEFGHGLGFTVGPTNGQTGARNSGSPSIWERFMVDNQTGLTWFEMTSNAQRAASAIGIDRLVWAGANVTAAVPSVLRQGIATVDIAGPAVRAPRQFVVGEASFGPAIASAPFTAEVAPVVDQPDGNTGLACTALSANNARAVAGRIALVDRGTCNFIVKTANLQAAGAIGMLVVDNVTAGLPPNVGGVNPAATIPSASVRLVDGNYIKEQLKRRTRSSTGVFATLGLTGTQYAGADALGRIKLFTPNPFQGGSSVSHYDVTAFRHQLMEPAINGDLTQSVLPPQDLTFRLFQDIGW
jgi:PA domain